MTNKISQASPSQLLALLTLLALLVPLNAAALNVDEPWHKLNGEFEYLEDPAGNITLDDLLNRPADFAFTSSAASKPGGSFDPLWLRLQLSGSAETIGDTYLVLARLENLYELQVFRPDSHGNYTALVTGNNYPASSRELKAPRYGFYVHIEQEPQTIYIRMIGGPGANNLAWDLVEHDVYQEQSPLYYMVTVGCFAAIFALLLFNFFIAVSLRRLDYLFYSAYVCSVLMALITLEGFGFYKLWPDYPAFNQSAMHTFNLLSASLRLLAVIQFLHMASLAPRLTKASYATIGLLVVAIIAVNLRGTPNLPPFAPTIPWILGILMGFVICIQAIRLHVPLAWPLLIALTVPGITALAQALLTVNSPNVGIVETQLAKLGFTLHVLMFSICLAAHIKQEIEARAMALHDSLTDLPGARLLEEHFDWQQKLAIREQQSMALLFIDLDGFKQVNDSLGHAAGDELLCQVAARMSAEVRASDFVARLGGDEFVVLLSCEPSIEPACTVSKKLVEALARPFSLKQGQATIGASIGIAQSPEDGDSLTSLLAAADAAMYQAKRNGKNGFAVSGEPLAG